MPYLIQTRDHIENSGMRETLRNEHRAHLVDYGDLILASGAILADDGDTIIGGMTILDTDNRAEAENFAASDPYAVAGLHVHTMVVRWRKRWWDGDFLPLTAPEKP